MIFEQIMRRNSRFALFSWARRKIMAPISFACVEGYVSSILCFIFSMPSCTDTCSTSVLHVHGGTKGETAAKAKTYHYGENNKKRRPHSLIALGSLVSTRQQHKARAQGIWSTHTHTCAYGHKQKRASKKVCCRLKTSGVCPPHRRHRLELRACSLGIGHQLGEPSFQLTQLRTVGPINHTRKRDTRKKREKHRVMSKVSAP